MPEELGVQGDDWAGHRARLKFFAAAISAAVGFKWSRLHRPVN